MASFGLRRLLETTRRVAGSAAIIVLLIALIVLLGPLGTFATTSSYGCSLAQDHAAPSPDSVRDAPSVAGEEVTDQMTAVLVRWIGNHTDYDVTRTRRDPPEIRFCSTGGIISYEGKDIVVDKEMVAAYDRVNRVIYLVRPWSASSLLDISKVLHELIHDVQFQNRQWHCIQKPEWETYKLQARWLAEHGVEKKFDWSKVFQISQCPEDIMPMIPGFAR